MGRSHLTTAIVLAGCAGFLLGVLWMDLMFDVQALGHPAAVPDQALASIASYYRRVTTDAAPMGGLIATVMLIAVGSALLQAVRAPGWRSAVALLLIVFPVALALIRVVPNAVRLGGRGDPADIQGARARHRARSHRMLRGGRRVPRHPGARRATRAGEERLRRRAASVERCPMVLAS